MSDKWYNRWLKIRRLIMILIGANDHAKIPSGYPTVTDNFWNYDKKKLDQNYHLSQPWGFYHPEKAHEHYDSDAITFHNGKGMELWVTDGEFNGPIYIDRGIGLVCSKFNLSYGLYEWNVIMPQGAFLWPAVWLSHSKTWPPEIDVMEGLSDEDGEYGDRIGTNFHYGKPDVYAKAIGGLNHGKGLDIDSVLNLKCHWTKDFVKIYYNNILVRVTTDLRIISNLNEDPWMKVIMNNSIQKKYDIEKQSVSPMIIQNFIYYKTK